MRLYDKVKWILGILMIITLVITTNMVDRSNFLRISDAIETIYEDRLVVKDLILKVSDIIHKKEIAAIRADSGFYARQNEQLNRDIESYLVRYDETKLTTQESEFLNDFKKNFSALKAKELEFVASNYADNSSLLKQFPEINNNLTNLAEIQLKEGGRQLEISRRAMDTMDLFTQIEIYIIVFLAIAIQIVVMYSPKSE